MSYRRSASPTFFYVCNPIAVASRSLTGVGGGARKPPCRSPLGCVCFGSTLPVCFCPDSIGFEFRAPAAQILAKVLHKTFYGVATAGAREKGGEGVVNESKKKKC